MRRIAFVDRDGTVIAEPDDLQVDTFEKLRFVDAVIPALLTLRDAGFELVMVSNQDGLGTASFPHEAFAGPHRLMLQVLSSQGVEFREILIDESFEHEAKPTRKPGVGLLLPYLRDRDVDLAGSAVIGDRETDLQLARNLGCRGFRIGPGYASWPEVAHALANAPRIGRVARATSETRIRVEVDLDRVADPVIATGIAFFDHMLEQLGKHGGFALTLHCDGDLRVDEHHTVEDSGLALGQALRRALGDKRGLVRYGQGADEGEDGAVTPGANSAAYGGGASRDGGDAVVVTLPMDEARACAALDLSGRPWFVFEGEFVRAQVGGLPTELVPHFFRSLCEAGGINLHLAVRGDNSHHQVEACFKAVARALRQALRRDGRDLPSTKGAL